MTNQKPKRQRLSNKQLWLLINIFEAGQPVTDALRNLNIRPGTFARWLTKPVFVERLRMHINHFYLEARMELARTAPGAISGLAFLKDKSLRHGEVRNACNDLLNFHTQLAKITGKKQPQNGAVSDNFGLFWDQFCVVLDNNGAVSDKLGNTKTPQKPVLTAKNAENNNSEVKQAAQLQG